MMLPALALGCDWCGLDAPPPRMTLGRGEVRFGADGPDFGGYEVVVVQTPCARGLARPRSASCRPAGRRVFCDVDYDLHAFDQPTARCWR